MERQDLKHKAKAYHKATSLILKKQGIDIQQAKLVRATPAARNITLDYRFSINDLERILRMGDQIAYGIGLKNVIVQRYFGNVRVEYLLPRQQWEFYKKTDMPTNLTIGLASGKEPVVFDLSEETPHSLFAGTTGSGKTEAIKTGLVGLLKEYRPEELGIGVVDVMGKYKDFHNSAHLIQPIAQKPEDISDLINMFYNEMNDRKNGGDRDKKLLLVLDEANDPTILGDKLSINRTNLAKISNLARQARNVGIHLAIGTQSPYRADLPGVLQLLNNRWVGYVDNAQMSAQATGHPGLNAEKLTKVGDFLHVINGNAQRFQVSLTTNGDYNVLKRGQVDKITTTPLFIAQEPKVGRPEIEIDYKLLARYLLQLEKGAISRNQAKVLWDVTRTKHERHNSLAVELYNNILELGGKVCHEV